MNFMNARVFVDTNILIYAHDTDARDKQTQAARQLRELWENGNGILSVQVLQEFYVNITRKIAKPLPLAQARGLVALYTAWEVITPEPAAVLLASEMQERHQLSFWDAMILTAAIQGNAELLLTEDLNHGQMIEGILVQNPLLH